MTWVKSDVDDETHRMLRIAAAERDVTISEITHEILETHAEEWT
jgi:AmiR/NasT family two-component response regulator